MSDHSFERPTLITIVVMVSWLVVLSAIAYLAHPRTTSAQLASQSGFSYLNITSATNTQLKAAGGTLHNIMINGGTLTGTITVVDTSAANCSGGNNIAIIAANQVAGQNYVYDLQFVNGACITTAAAVNLTVDYR